MRVIRSGSAAAAIGMVACLLAAARSPVAAAAQSVQSQGEPSAQFDRPDAAAIRAETRAILADPRFAPRQTITQWLFGKLRDLRLPGLKLSEGLGALLLWLVLIWCVITLVAILVHIGWTLAVLLRTRIRVRGLAGPRPTRVQAVSYEEIRRQMELLARQGRLREALGTMMTALLRRLDAAQVVTFHQSKTNGDYVREYPGARPERDVFRRFTVAFDGIVYGSAPCNAEEYGRMEGMFKHVVVSVHQEP